MIMDFPRFLWVCVAGCYGPARHCQTAILPPNLPPGLTRQSIVFQKGGRMRGGSGSRRRAVWSNEMADLPRLNNIIRALEAGQHALTCFAPAHVDSAIGMSASKYDGCVFEMEHNPWDSGRLRDCLQYMLNRAQIAKAGLVPPVTPLVRIPVNG